MKKHEQYMCALLSNPEWMRSTIERFGRNGSIGMPELASAISILDKALSEKFADKEFDVESFCKDSNPPPPNSEGGLT